MSKNIKVGDVVRIFEGVGKGQKQVVRDIVDLPMGTGIVVMLDHGELETLNPANVEVFSADGVDDEDEDGSVCEVCGDRTLYGSRHHACGEYALRMESRIRELEADQDLIRRIKALEIYVSNLEAHLRGHEKYAHEKIGKHIADLTKSQKFVREYLDEHVDEYLADLNSGQRRIRNEIAELRDAIARARDRWQDAMRLAAQPAKDRDTFRDRLHAMELAAVEHRTLIHAGALIGLGPLGDDDEKPR